jgi:hypothetical protein
MKQDGDYTNAVVYIIDCLDISVPDIYIGSTPHFHKTVANLKKKCTSVNNKSFLHTFIKNNGGISNFRITILETIVNCKDKKEMLNKQIEHMDFRFPNLNKKLPIIPDRERYFTENAKSEMKEHRQMNTVLSYILRKEFNANLIFV